jgi:thiol-disulfide isomerase/thioredoxin
MVLGAGAFFVAISLSLAVFCATRAEAIPAFSREYKTECTTCHTIFPQLNEFGQAYERNGFVWPGAVPMSKKVKVTQTEEERKSREYIKLSGIPAVIPVSFLTSVSYLYNEKVEDNFDMKRFSAEILTGGAFGGDRIGFWFHESLGSQSTTATNSLSGPSNLYFVARHPLGAPVHVKAGRFSPDLSLWKTTLNGRLLSMGASVDGFSLTGAQNTLEVSSFLGPRVLAVVGMNDRNNSSDAKAPHSVNDFYGRVSAKFGGTDYHGKEPDIDLDKDSVWDFLSLSVGAYGYSGSTSKGDGVDHDLTRIGLEAEAAYKKWLLMVGATLGENNAEADDPLKSTALSAEVDYLFSAQFAAAVRYDSLDVDGKDLRTVVTPCVIFAPLQNFRLRLSVAIDSNPSNAATGKAVENTTATLTASMSF